MARPWGLGFGIILGVVIGLSAETALRPSIAASTADQACSDPVFLVVWIDNLHNRERSGAYAKALRESGLVREHGGEYLMVSPPIKMLEGDWPEDRGLVIEKYPCEDAFDSFWFSDQYQKEIVPLRDNTGNYTVGLFKAL